MNKSLLTLSLIPIASVMHTYGTSHVPDNRPNIILFLVDDIADAKTMCFDLNEGVQEDFRPVTPNNDAE